MPLRRMPDDDDFPLEEITGHFGLHIPPDKIAASQEALLVLDDKFFDLLLFHTTAQYMRPLHNSDRHFSSGRDLLR